MQSSTKPKFMLTLDELRNDPGFTTLDLSHQGLDETAAEELTQALSKNKTLVELNLSHNLIGDAGSFVLFFFFFLLGVANRSGGVVVPPPPKERGPLPN